MGRRVARMENPDVATAVTPRHSRWSGVVDISIAPLPFPHDPACRKQGGRVVRSPARLPPPSGRRHLQTVEQQSHDIWRHAMTRRMILMVAMSLTVLSIMLGASRELWPGPPF